MRRLVMVALLLMVLSSCKPDNQPIANSNTLQQNVVLPIQTRSFLVGTSGYAPANFPNSNSGDVQQFWADVSKGDVFGVHTDWKDTKIVGISSKLSGADLAIVLGFQNPNDWEKADVLAETAKQLLRENKNIRYVGIGNEVNIIYEDRKDEFDSFISAYKKAYSSIKSEFPEVKIFTTFQLEAMKGAGYLTGRKRAQEWDLLEKFGDSLDIVGFTTYAYLDYTDPEKIPADYYKEISKHTNKEIAFTEIGWPSRKEWGGKFSYLNEKGFTGSEEEQVRFLNRFLQITGGMDIEFANWIFVNDIVEWSDGKEPGQFPLFDSVGLKHHDGRQKAIWDYWVALGELPKS